MDGHDEDRPSASTAVPDLIERFRLRRDAWIAQADELARLRDEVRGSAEREAMEIVTGARQDVRQVVMEARRELLVLSAQVQAALGEVSEKPDPTTLLHKVGIDAGEFPAAEAAAQPIDAGFAPEAAIEKILNEVQADMTALADEARSLPGRAVGASDAAPAALPAAPESLLGDDKAWAPSGPNALSAVEPARPEPAEDASRRAPSRVPAPERPVLRPPDRSPEPELLSSAGTPLGRALGRAPEPEPASAPEPDSPLDVPLEAPPAAPPGPDATGQASATIRERIDRLDSAAGPAGDKTGTRETPEPGTSPAPDAQPTGVRRAIGLSEAASKALLSVPMPSESVPVPSGRSLWTFVALFAAIGLIVVMATTWWMGGDDEGSVQAGQAELASDVTARPAPEPGGVVTAPPAAAEAVPAAAEPSSPPPPPPGGPGNLWVAGEAVREVWVRTTIDGRQGNGRTLAEGDTISVAADRTIALRVGDAGALLVSVNQGAWLPLGLDGEVVTREFEADAAGTIPAPPPILPEGAARLEPASAPPAVSSSTPVPGRAAAPAPAGATVTPADLRAPAPRPVVASASLPVASEVATPASQVGDVRAAESAVLAAAERWLDAYHRDDRATMARLSAENLLLADERSADERFPPGLSDVQRKLDGVRVQISADMAVLTAVMTERSGSSDTSRVSPVSQIWVLGEGEWKVRQARFVSEARLNQVLR